MATVAFAHEHWSGPVVEVHNVVGELLAIIPLSFITESKATSTWRYVVDVVDLITGTEPALPPLVRISSSGTLVSLDDIPVPGVFIYDAGGALDVHRETDAYRGPGWAIG